MENEKSLKQSEQTSGDQAEGGSTGMDRNEGQTLNGTVGGSGSELENASERLGGNEQETKKGSENENVSKSSSS